MMKDRLMASSSSSKQCVTDEVGDEKKWEEVVCPICMEHPHDAILLICTSHDKGCRPFICDTSPLLSNCFDQLMKPFAADAIFVEESGLSCPFCRGKITGFDVEHPARGLMNSMTRSCPLATCRFSGNYGDLRMHARSEHPSVRPSEVSPAQQQKWTETSSATMVEWYLGDYDDDDDDEGSNERSDGEVGSNDETSDDEVGSSDVTSDDEVGSSDETSEDEVGSSVTSDDDENVIGEMVGGLSISDENSTK